MNANGTAGAEQILIDNEWCQQFTSHSVGHLAFGPDGYLYVTGGDGASYENADWGQFGGSLAGTPDAEEPVWRPARRQGRRATRRRPAAAARCARRARAGRRASRALLNGALLRINPDTGAGVPGNPMYNASTPSANASRILAYGMRNPFRFTHPSRHERDLGRRRRLGDLGGDQPDHRRRRRRRRRTSAGPASRSRPTSSGYRDLDMCKALYTDTVDPPTDPYFAYEHGVAVNGNDTCGRSTTARRSPASRSTRGNKYPAQYQNALFFADNARNCIYVMTAGANGLPDPSTARTFIDDADNPFPVDLEADPVSKDIFYVNIALGTVNRISYASSNRAPTAVATRDADVGHRAARGAAQRLGVDRPRRRHAHLLVGHRRQRQLRRRDRQDADRHLRERRHLPGPAAGDRPRWPDVAPSSAGHDHRDERQPDRRTPRHPAITGTAQVGSTLTSTTGTVDRHRADHLRAPVAALHHQVRHVYSDAVLGERPARVLAAG